MPRNRALNTGEGGFTWMKLTGLLATGIFRFCPLNSIVEINSCDETDGGCCK